MSGSDSPGNADSLPILDIVGSYTTDKSVELAGNASALLELAARLGADEPTKTYVLTVPLIGSPAPYDGFLEAIRIIQRDGPVEISREGKDLVITGSPDNLSALSLDISSIPDQTYSGVAPHIHVEYYPGHPYLASSALPMVIALASPKSE